MVQPLCLAGPSRPGRARPSTTGQNSSTISSAVLEPTRPFDQNTPRFPFKTPDGYIS